MPYSLEEIQEALKLARERAGFKRQDEAARSIGVTKSQLSQWEKGSREPMLSNFLHVLKGYDLSLAEFEGLVFEAAKKGALGPYDEVLQQVARLADRIARIEAQTPPPRKR